MNKYTEEELIQFGNYLLSDKRNEMVDENNRNMVHHADIENFKYNQYHAEGTPEWRKLNLQVGDRIRDMEDGDLFYEGIITEVTDSTF